MKNKLLLSAIFFISIIVVNAQSSLALDDIIKENFTDKEISKMPAEGLGSLDYWKFFAQNGYKVIDISKTKSVDFKTISIDEDLIDPFDKQFSQNETKDSYYKIEGTEKLIILFSKQGVDYRYQHPEVFKFGY